jgi:hypothetical protein
MQSPKSSTGKTANFCLRSSIALIVDAFRVYLHIGKNDGANKQFLEVMCSCLGSFLNWGEGLQKLSEHELS